MKFHHLSLLVWGQFVGIGNALVDLDLFDLSVPLAYCYLYGVSIPDSNDIPPKRAGSAHSANATDLSLFHGLSVISSSLTIILIAMGA